MEEKSSIISQLDKVTVSGPLYSGTSAFAPGVGVGEVRGRVRPVAFVVAHSGQVQRGAGHGGDHVQVEVPCHQVARGVRDVSSMVHHCRHVMEIMILLMK